MNNYQKVNNKGKDEQPNYATEYKNKQISKYIKHGYILDIGCRKGFIRNKLYYSDTYYGIDFLDFKEPIQKHTYPHQSIFIQQDITKKKIQLNTNSFDTIILGDIIEHLADKQNLLNECYRLLKKDGILIITTPNYHINHCFTQITNTKILGGYDEHICSFWEKDLINLLKFHKFKCLHMKRILNILYYHNLIKIHLPEINLFTPFALYLLGVFKK